MRDGFRRRGQNEFGVGESCGASRVFAQRPIEKCQGRFHVPDSVWRGVVRFLVCEVLLGEARSDTLDQHKLHPDDSLDGRASRQRAECRQSAEGVESRHVCLLPSIGRVGFRSNSSMSTKQQSSHESASRIALMRTTPGRVRIVQLMGN